MSRSIRALLVGALATAVIVFGAASAFAAPVTWQSVDVVLHDETPSPVLLVSGELPKGAKLPAEAMLAVPSGLQLNWIGEVLGGPMDQDPTVTPKVTKSGGSDIYAFTVSKGPRAQVELTAPSAIVADGSQRNASLEWTAPQDLPRVTLQIRVPINSQLGDATKGGVLKPGPTGFQYYERAVENVKAGDKLELDVVFTPPAGTPVGGQTAATTAPSSSSDTVVLFILVGGLAAVGIALGVSVRRKMAEREAAAVPVKRTTPKATTASTSKKGSHSTSASASRKSSKSRKEPQPEPPAPRKAPVGLVATGVAVVLVVVVLFAVNAGTKPVIAGGKISTTVTQIDPCSVANFTLTLPQGTAVEDAAEKLFDVLRKQRGIGVVTVYTDGQPRLEVNYCQSNNTEDGIWQALSPTGLVARDGGSAPQGAAPATSGSSPTEAASDGSKQTLKVDASNGSFAPTQLEAKTGTPIEIEFSQGQGCVGQVAFPSLNISQDLQSGPVKIALGELEPGTYQFQCGMAMQFGSLVVR